MTKDEALKLALEALEYASTGNRRPEIIGPAITAIKAALAQPAQREPLIAFRHGCKWCGELNGCEHKQPAQEPEIHSRWQETIAGIPVIFESESEANRFMEYHLANAGKPIEQPPQRTWVGLDEKDFSAINQSCLTKLQAATSAESILKEKNNGLL